MESKKANDELYCKGLRPMLGSDTQTFLSLISKKWIHIFIQNPATVCVHFWLSWAPRQPLFRAAVQFCCDSFHKLIHLPRALNTLYSTLYYTILAPFTLWSQYSIHPASGEWARLGKTCGFIRRTCDYFHKGGKELKSFKQVAAFYHTLTFRETG